MTQNPDVVDVECELSMPRHEKEAGATKHALSGTLRFLDATPVAVDKVPQLWVFAIRASPVPSSQPTTKSDGDADKKESKADAGRAADPMQDATIFLVEEEAGKATKGRQRYCEFVTRAASRVFESIERVYKTDKIYCSVTPAKTPEKSAPPAPEQANAKPADPLKGCELIGFTESKGSANDRPAYIGPEGGVFYLSSGGNREYIRLVQRTDSTERPPDVHFDGEPTDYVLSSTGSANGRPIYRGPRGGMYYLTDENKRSYVSMQVVGSKCVDATVDATKSASTKTA